MAIPSDHLPIGPGLTPTGAEGASFFISRSELEKLQRDGPEWKYDDARFIREAIQAPDVIFEGLGRHGLRESLCYSVRLTRDPEQPDSELPPRFGYVFLVYVRTDSGYLVFDWGWREEDPEAPGYPVNWRTDFARPTWSR